MALRFDGVGHRKHRKRLTVSNNNERRLSLVGKLFKRGAEFLRFGVVQHRNVAHRDFAAAHKCLNTARRLREGLCLQ